MKKLSKGNDNQNLKGKLSTANQASGNLSVITKKISPALCSPQKIAINKPSNPDPKEKNNLGPTTKGSAPLLKKGSLLATSSKLLNNKRPFENSPNPIKNAAPLINTKEKPKDLKDTRGANPKTTIIKPFDKDASLKDAGLKDADLKAAELKAADKAELSLAPSLETINKESNSMIDDKGTKCIGIGNIVAENEGRNSTLISEAKQQVDINLFPSKSETSTDLDTPKTNHWDPNIEADPSKNPQPLDSKELIQKSRESLKEEKVKNDNISKLLEETKKKNEMTMNSINGTLKSLSETLSGIKETERKFKEFEDSYNQAIRTMVENIAKAFAHQGMEPFLTIDSTAKKLKECDTLLFSIGSGDLSKIFLASLKNVMDRVKNEKSLKNFPEYHKKALSVLRESTEMIKIQNFLSYIERFQKFPHGKAIFIVSMFPLPNLPSLRSISIDLICAKNNICPFKKSFSATETIANIPETVCPKCASKLMLELSETSEFEVALKSLNKAPKLTLLTNFSDEVEINFVRDFSKLVEDNLKSETGNFLEIGESNHFEKMLNKETSLLEGIVEITLPALLIKVKDLYIHV